MKQKKAILVVLIAMFFIIPVSANVGFFLGSLEGTFEEDGSESQYQNTFFELFYDDKEYNYSIAYTKFDNIGEITSIQSVSASYRYIFHNIDKFDFFGTLGVETLNYSSSYFRLSGLDDGLRISVGANYTTSDKIDITLRLEDRPIGSGVLLGVIYKF